jgi:hypothetical protein
VDQQGPVPWPAVWQDVAVRLRGHRTAGRGHLLTEDVVRMESVLALEQVGVRPARLTAEYLAPELRGGKVDLVLDAPSGAVIELKYPRDSRTGISPDTMTFGELLRDFLRVAVLPGHERWVVQVIGTRLARYLHAVERRHDLRWTRAVGEEMVLKPTALAGLPVTATQALGSIARETVVRARCEVAEQIDDELGLYAYSVAGAGLEPAAHPEPGTTAGRAVSVSVSQAKAASTGARGEILDAIAAVTSRSGRPTFTVLDVLGELRRRGSRYAESTIQTMISSHMCASSSGPGTDPHTDLERVDRGIYRLSVHDQNAR